MDTKAISFQTNNNISIVQFLIPEQNTLEYISGPNALTAQHIVVKEISEQANVNKIFLENTSPYFVFFMDGDILIGAKQNRVLNTSIFVAPNSKIILPVSCVEQGRWNYSKPVFDKSPDIGTSYLRAKKAKNVTENLRRDKKFDSNQGEVWEDVHLYCMAMEERSETSDFNILYEKKVDEFSDTLKMFRLVNNANGISVFVKNRLLHIEIFNRTDIYAEYFPKILRSALIETYRLKASEKILSEAEAYYKTQELLDTTEKLEYSENPGVGIGVERRFNSEHFTGFDLSYNQKIVHLTLLNLVN